MTYLARSTEEAQTNQKVRMGHRNPDERNGEEIEDGSGLKGGTEVGWVYHGVVVLGTVGFVEYGCEMDGRQVEEWIPPCMCRVVSCRGVVS